MTYIKGETIKKLREKKALTQGQLAERLMLSDKTISKWETNRGLPDISILSELAEALSVSVPELLTGDVVKNQNVSANMKNSKFYVCPVCGNVIHATGEGAFWCCGIRLPEAEADEAEEKHFISTELIENELFVHMEHPMQKEHFISFLAYVTSNQVQLEKLYPEQSVEIRFRRAGHGKLYAYCNRHGLFEVKI